MRLHNSTCRRNGSAVHNDSVTTVLFLVLGVNLIAKGIPPLTR